MIADAPTVAAIVSVEPRQAIAPRTKRALLVIPNLTEAAPIVVEIAERFHELEEIKIGLSADIVQRLANLADESLTAYRFTIRLMHGDGRIFDSFEDQANIRAMSKQAVHAEFRIILSTIERVFPELAWQIREQRRAIHEIEIDRWHSFDDSQPGRSDHKVVTVNRQPEEGGGNYLGH